MDGHPVLLLSPGELLWCCAFVSLHADDKRWTFFNNNTLESWLFQPPWKSKLFWIIGRFKKIIYLKSEGSRNQESAVFKLIMRSGMLWRNVTFFIWRCKCLALLDAIFKVLYIVCIFKNCTHSCPSIFIVISIILINTLIPVVQAGKDVSYFGIILIGFAITGKFLISFYLIPQFSVFGLLKLTSRT